MKKSSIKIFFAFILLNLFVLNQLFASLLITRPLSEVLPKIKAIVQGKVDSVKINTTNNHATEVYYIITIEKVILGNLQPNTIRAKYSEQSSVIQSKEGEIIGTKSLIVDGSGLELEVKENKSYLFFFGSSIKNENEYNNIVTRVDSIEKKEEVIKFIE